MSTFCQRSYHRKVQRNGVGGKKNQNFVNVVCERPLTRNTNIFAFFLYQVSPPPSSYSRIPADVNGREWYVRWYVLKVSERKELKEGNM